MTISVVQNTVEFVDNTLADTFGRRLQGVIEEVADASGEIPVPRPCVSTGSCRHQKRKHLPCSDRDAELLQIVGSCSRGTVMMPMLHIHLQHRFWHIVCR